MEATTESAAAAPTDASEAGRVLATRRAEAHREIGNAAGNATKADLADLERSILERFARRERAAAAPAPLSPSSSSSSSALVAAVAVLLLVVLAVWRRSQNP